MTKVVKKDEPTEIQRAPKRRAEFMQPPTSKRTYKDGIPALVSPASKLRQIMQKVVDQYKFSPLKKDEDIRVLVLERGGRASPGREADPVVCRLLPCALPSSQGQQSSHNVPVYSYEALSYYWGQDAAPTMAITIITRPSMEHTVHKKFYVRPNLHAALVELRSTTEEVRLWVDAICIDQETVEEKTSQVSRMHEIYSNAKSTCIWLGVGDVNPLTKEVDHKSTERTFEFIRNTLRLKLDELVSDAAYARDWYSFVELMRNRWFSRRWVVQELAFAKEATVHCGKEVMQWTDFADAVALFVEKHDQINALLKGYSTQDPDPIGDMRALGANTLVEATSNLFRRSNGGEIIERLLPLEVLVSTLLPFEATDPKDTIYAVLSIASDTPYVDVMSPNSLPPSRDPRVTPNYKNSETEIFTDFIDYCIDTSGSLDIICRYWAPAPKGRRRNTSTFDPSAHRHMPTWVSVITGSAFGGPEVLLEGRCNGDSLVGTTSRKHHRNYNASGGLKPSYRIDKVRDPENDKTSDGQSQGVPQPYTQAGHTSSNIPSKEYQTTVPKMVLYVKGYCLDIIKKLSPRVAEGNILQECLEMGSWTPNKWLDDERPTRVPDSLWRTLVADRGPNGTNTPSWYHRACLDCFAHITQNGVLNIMALMDKPNTASTMVKFLKRVQEVVWNRKFLQSRGGDAEEEDKQLFGLAPTSAREGDMICILFGCSVPVLLREMGPPEDRHYHFVGEVYVHEMMDGEAISKGPGPEYPYHGFTEFEIR